MCSLLAEVRGRRAFTLVELLVVIAIIGILIALLLPAVQAARESGRRSQCSNNLKQIGIALHNYHGVHQCLPFGCGHADSLPQTGTWAAFILPYIEEQKIYDQFNFRLAMNDPGNANAVQWIVATYICPSDAGASEAIFTTHNLQLNPAVSIGLWYPVSIGPTMMDACPFCPNQNSTTTNYCCQGWNFGTDPSSGVTPAWPAGSTVGMFGRFWLPKIRFANVTDGLSKTLMAGETIPSHCTWNGAYNPNFPVSGTGIPINTMQSDDGSAQNWFIDCGFKSRHPAGATFIMGDGSVQFLVEEIDYQLYNNLGTRAGGETVVFP